MRHAESVEHTTVYRRPGRFGGWPANYGMWGWDDEIVIMFTEGTFKNMPQGHKRDRDRPFVTLQGRSMDGGRTWDIEPFAGPTPGGKGISADEHMNTGLQIGNPYNGLHPPTPFTGTIDFTDPETSVVVARTTCQNSPGRVFSWFHVSYDRCRSRQGPFRFTGLDDSLMLSGRTDIVPLGRHHALFLLTAHKSDGGEGKVLCAETTDGGRSFSLKSQLQEGDPEGYEIMPSSVRCEDGRILTAVRVQAPGGKAGIALYESCDQGATWTQRPSIVESLAEGRSNPPALLQLPDGRLCVIFGYRAAPFGIRSRISDDAGVAWSDDIVLRDDGGDFDIGYPRAVIRSDGKVVVGYYLDTDPDGERFIAASIWDAAIE